MVNPVNPSKSQRFAWSIRSQVPVVNPVNPLLMLEVNPVNPLQVFVVNPRVWTSTGFFGSSKQTVRLLSTGNLITDF